MPVSPNQPPAVALFYSSDPEEDLLKETVDQLRPLYLSGLWYPLEAVAQWQSLADQAESAGCRVWVAFGGGPRSPAARLAALTGRPVLALPPLTGRSSLSRVQQAMKTSRDNAPVATLALGRAGARNAALLAAAIIANNDRVVAAALRKFREQQTSQVLAASLD